ncbi:hypothetical protein BPUN_3491 [Candidatus Paraburkholderia kirkii]|nr:hypothetical protein BPUN_3491 [Candidatus Paraburkholderia kirkii]
MIDECFRHPFKGTGKPEPLKREKARSRRIDEKNRFVYVVTDAQLLVISCRGHDGDK